MKTRADSQPMGRKFGVRRAFTIVEVMIVLAIILAITTLVVVNLRGDKKEAQIRTANIALRTFEKALERFNDKFGRFPSDDEGLKVLWDKTSLQTENEEQAAKWERFIDRAEDAEKDPWGRPWMYRQKDERDGGAGDQPDIWSMGPDGQDGTEDDIHARKAAGSGGATSGGSGGTSGTGG